MEFLEAAILGMIQGLTEFLPVSSTGHLIIAEKLLGFDSAGIKFDIIVHFGTLLALLIFFRHTWAEVLAEAFHIFKPVSHKEKRARMLMLLAIGTLPAVFFGFMFEDAISNTFREVVLVSVMLAAVAFIFLIAEKFARRSRVTDSLDGKDSFIIGLFQAIALIPGVSRSGITIVGGLFRGLERGEATRFAFMLSAPVIFGAGLKSLMSDGLAGLDPKIAAVGFISSAFFGYVAVKFMIERLNKLTLVPFAYYRIGLALILLLLVFTGNL